MEINQVAQASTAIALAGIALAVGLQKVLKGWRETSTEGSVLDMMHKELGRMSIQNTTLSLELGKLQQEIIKLNSELTKLAIENQKLHFELSTLNLEIGKFKIRESQ